MELIRYTTPKIKKGKEIIHVPKGSSKAKEEAKQMWYVEYFFDGKQQRVKKGINRIYDHIEKQAAAEALVQFLKEELSAGYNPLNPVPYILKSEKDNISLVDAIKIFKEYHLKHNSKSKTISTYLSKLNALSTYYPGKLLQEITTKSLEEFVQRKIEDGLYAHNSVKSAKRIFSAFFTVMIKQGYTKINSKIGFDSKINSKKKINEKHTPYTDADLERVLNYLDVNDKFTAFYCRAIYYICIRPGELRGLQVKDVDLVRNTITIPASVKKNTRNQNNDEIPLYDGMREELEKLQLSKYPTNYYLTGSTTNIVGASQVGINTAYEKLMTALVKIDKEDKIKNPDLKEGDRIINKGYGLYSFKHKSNINKYLKNGWKLEEIMKANRHTNISTTEIYLRKLGIFVETTNLMMTKI